MRLPLYLVESLYPKQCFLVGIEALDAAEHHPKTSWNEVFSWSYHRWKHGCHVGSSASSSRYDNQAFARIVKDLKWVLPSDYFEKSWSEECLYLIISNFVKFIDRFTSVSIDNNVETQPFFNEPEFKLLVKRGWIQRQIFMKKVIFSEYFKKFQ